MSAATVLKIGGSLAESDAAAQLMRRLSALRLARLVVVPGGGDYADAVRRAQRRHGFADPAAHRMALVAMHISALQLAALGAGFALAESVEEFERAWERGATPIWAPERMALAAPEIPQSWDVTSDSLAAWLAARIEAARLVLVKSCPVAGHMARDAEALARAGIVDASFPEFVRARGFTWRVVSGMDGALAALDE